VPENYKPAVAVVACLDCATFLVTLTLAVSANGSLLAEEAAMLSPGDAIEVIRGDPKLLDQLSGKIVVLGAWSNISMDGDSRTKISRAERQQMEKTDARCKQLARDFKNTANKFKAQPDVVFIGQASTSLEQTKEALLENAVKLGFTGPIVRFTFHKTVPVPPGWWGGKGKVSIFNSDGLPIYIGELDSNADAAIRSALKAKVGQNVFGK
jgi:hypothetical protein